MVGEEGIAPTRPRKDRFYRPACLLYHFNLPYQSHKETKNCEVSKLFLLANLDRSVRNAKPLLLPF